MIELWNVDVSLGGRRVLRDVSWRMEPGQSWAVIGGNGAGKSTLLSIIRGDLWPEPGRGRRLYRLGGGQTSSPLEARRCIAIVSAERQARYARSDWSLAGREVVHTGFFDRDLLHETPTVAQSERAEAVLEELGIADLAERSIRRMSQGELRAVLVARALVRDPALLVLDEVCAGLDAEARHGLLVLLDRIAGSGTPILSASHRPEDAFPALSHALYLERGEVAWQGERRSMPDHLMLPRPSGPAPPPATTVRPTPPVGGLDTPRGYVIEIEHADVVLDGEPVLQDITWRMGEGEHWSIAGRNGAGKSTFLKLILGELHPALGGRVHRFGSESRVGIREIKRRIGLVSNDLQDRYRKDLTAYEVTASGFSSSIGLFEPVTAPQERRVLELLDLFGLTELADRSILRLSYGQARKVLVARALVHEPRILLLDEPFDGLDSGARHDLGRILESIAERGTSLVLVSHYDADLPPFLTHGLLLDRGRIAAQGPLDEVLAPAPERSRQRRTSRSAPGALQRPS